eukprot:m.458359 g.458359  ORF g.458359 m.458359 type:complete len:236 (+) comp56990_c0_seq6:646-1353(+)
MHHALPISNGRVLEENQARIQEASTICVIGAGPAGVQLAADLCHHYRTKTIHLIASNQQLLPQTPSLASQHAEEYFAEYPNVEIHYSTRVAQVEANGNVLLSNGTVIASQVAFACAGSTPNTGFMQMHLAQLLNANGAVHVDEYFRAAPNIFAIGDVNDSGEVCLAGGARRQAVNVVQNLHRLLHQQPLRIKPRYGRTVIVFGSKDAVWIDYVTGRARVSTLWWYLKKWFQMVAR